LVLFRREQVSHAHGIEQPGGRVIINISSMAGVGLGPHPAPLYAASKAAVVRFTAALAPLGRRLNIRVNCICPDWVDTPMTQRTRAAVSPEEWRAIAPPVMTQPEEIAEAVVKIIDDDSLAGRVMLCVGAKPWPPPRAAETTAGDAVFVGRPNKPLHPPPGPAPGGRPGRRSARPAADVHPRRDEQMTRDRSPATHPGPPELSAAAASYRHG